MPSFGTPTHLDLSVSDAGAGARWHCEMLGLNQHATVPIAGSEDRNVVLDHIGFSVRERTNLDSWEQQLTTLQVANSPAEDTANGAALVFRDRVNIQLEFWWTRHANV